MPVFVDDPVLLSKERLKSELVAHSVPLPPGEKKKQVYLELYLKHVAHKKPADFSSDEEEEDGAPEGELRGPGEGAGIGHKETVIEEEDEDKNTEVMDVYQLTDEQLKGELIKHGVKPGPIVASTRALYEKKLQRLVDPSRKPAPELAQNSTHDASQYSDSEEDETVINEQTAVQKVTKTNMYLKSSSAQQKMGVCSYTGFTECRTVSGSAGSGPLDEPFSASQNWSRREVSDIGLDILDIVIIMNSFNVSNTLCSLKNTLCYGTRIPSVQRPACCLVDATGLDLPLGAPQAWVLTNHCALCRQGEYRPRKEDVLEEMFPDEVRTPTGISTSATRRRPIKGAAGRPVQFKYSEMVPHSRPLQQEKQEELRCFVPIWIQVLVFFALAGFFLFVYYTMNSLSEYTEISGQGSEV
uniref:LEM domain containing 1 n=1 Tax=Lepisosteus oculatus TaxID=7918 RepID=W5N1S3_LEPOC